LDKIKAWGLGALAFIVAIVWLITSSRRAGRKSAELKAEKRKLDNVEKAADVDKDIDALSPDAKRDRLRKHK